MSRAPLRVNVSQPDGKLLWWMCWLWANVWLVAIDRDLTNTLWQKKSFAAIGLEPTTFWLSYCCQGWLPVTLLLPPCYYHFCFHFRLFYFKRWTAVIIEKIADREVLIGGSLLLEVTAPPTAPQPKHKLSENIFPHLFPGISLDWRGRLPSSLSC